MAHDQYNKTYMRDSWVFSVRKEDHVRFSSV